MLFYKKKEIPVNATAGKKAEKPTNEQLARAASIYYGKLEGERLAREQAKQDRKNKRKHEKDADINPAATTANDSSNNDIVPGEAPVEPAGAEKIEPESKNKGGKKSHHHGEDKPKNKAPDPKAEEPEPSAEPASDKDNSVEVAATAPAHEEAVAAHPAGFNIQHFVNGNQQQSMKLPNPDQQPPVVQQSVPQQVVASAIPARPPVMQQPDKAFNPNPMLKQAMQPVDAPALEPAAVAYPAGYNTMTATQKCDAIRNMVANSQNTIMPPYDPRQDLSTEQKVEEVKKHITFIEGAHLGTDTIQIWGLLGLINSPLLRTKMTEYGSVDRPNNPKLYEVPVAKYGADAGKYDMAFELRLKDKKTNMVVLFGSVPVYNTATKSWNHDMSIFKI